MTKIVGITIDAKQKFRLLLPNGQFFTLTLEYKPLQIGWFCSVEYLDFFVRALRVSNSTNILSQFSDLIPFGLACFVTTRREPLFLEDFDSGAAVLCVLDSTDLRDLETFLGQET